MITQLGGRPQGLFGGQDPDTTMMETMANMPWRDWVLIAILVVVVIILVHKLVTGTFLGAPNQYNHIAWQGDGIQSWAFPMLRPWDKPPRHQMVYGVDDEEAARRFNVLKTDVRQV